MTTTDHSIPPLRNLPPGRLNQRKDHLLAEITSSSPRRQPLFKAQRRRWAHRPVLVAAAAVVASVLAGGAFALAHYVFVGAPAPADVQAYVEFESGVKATLQSHAATTGVIVSETKAAAVLDTAGGPAYLWLSPTTSGGYCLYLDFAHDRQPNGAPNMSGGCARGHAFAIDATFTWTRVAQTPVSLVYGYAEAPATRMQLHFQSGATKSANINGRYFMVEVPAGEGPGAADKVVSVDAVASDGHVVATQVNGQIAPPATP
jgi:hypothetical protein